MRYFLFLFLFVSFIWSSCETKSSFEVHQKPIQFDSTRAQLSLDYLSNRYGMEQDEPTITPKMIVIHWTAIPTFEKAYDFFYDSRLNPKRKDIEDESALNVSAHYMIKRNGEIYQLLPDTLFARHVIGLNHAAIGIENVGTKNNRLTDAQLQANIHLIRELTERHKIEYLIGHYEYTLFEEHSLWKEKDDGYRTEKVDPGKEFMLRLRKNLSDMGMNLKGPPETEVPLLAK